MKKVYKNLFITLSVLFMFLNLPIFEKEVKAESEKSYTKGNIVANASGNYSYKVYLSNFDTRSFNSITLSLLDENNQEVEVRNSTSLGNPSDLSESVDTTVQTFSFTNLEPNKHYSLKFEIDSPYEVHFYDEGEVAAGKGMTITNLQRFSITKTWDDNNNEKGDRPEPSAYANTLLFYENGNPVTPDVIVLESSDNNVYRYRVYGGLNIRNAITVDENPVPTNYELIESEGSVAFQTEPETENSYITNTGNTSKASLANKIIEYFDIKLTKVDKDDNSTKLANVQFEIINNSNRSILVNSVEYEHGTKIATITTDANGEASYQGLPTTGKYILKETVNPNEGYATPSWQKEFSNNDSAYDAENKLYDFGNIENKKPEYGGFIITKVDEDDAATTLPGAVFELYNNSDKQIKLKNGTTVEGKALIGTYTTDDNGQIIIDKLLPKRVIDDSADAQYRFKEIKAPNNYLITQEFYPSSTSNYFIEANINKEYTFKNTKEQTTGAKFEVTKQIIGNEATEQDYQNEFGFQLNFTFPANSDYDDSLYASAYREVDGTKYDLGEQQIKTNSSGELTFNYYFKLKANEKAVFIIPENEYIGNTGHFSIRENYLNGLKIYGYELNDGQASQQSDESYYADYTIDYNSPTTLTVKNYRQIEGSFGEIRLTKRKSGTSSGLYGAKFAVVNGSNETIYLAEGTEVEPGGLIQTVDMTNSSQTSTRRNLPIYLSDGETKVKYNIYEIKHPEGFGPGFISYVNNFDQWNDYPLVAIRELNSPAENVDYWTNYQYIYNTEFFQYKITKVDGDDETKKLEGATFDIYNNGGTININGTDYKQGDKIVSNLTTDANGEIITDKIFPIYTKLGNSTASYLIKETAAPEGYILKDTIYPAKDSDKGTIKELTITNDKPGFGGLAVEKIDANASFYKLEGAKFNIVNASGKDITLKDGTVKHDGEVVASFTTDVNGYGETGEILPDIDSEGNRITYYMIETKAPEGYIAYADRPISRQVYKGRTNSLRVANQKETGTFEFNKLLWIFKDESFEFEIELKDENGNPVNDWFYYIEVNEDGRTIIDEEKGMPYKDNLDAGYDKVEFVDGKASVTINVKGRKDLYYYRSIGRITIYDIPVGYTYTIKEKVKEGWYEIPYETDMDWNFNRDNNIWESGTIEQYNEFYKVNANDIPTETKISLEAKKILEGETLKDKQFSFELLDKNGKKIKEVPNDLNGNIKFDDITIKYSDLNVRYVNYEDATEEEKALSNLWRDNYYEDVLILNETIPDEAVGYVYPDGYITYGEATSEQKAQVYTWHLEDDTYIGEGFDDYDHLILTIFEGDLEYTIKEVVSNNKKYTYDTHEEKVKVSVYGSEFGQLKATIKYNNNKPTFINKTQPPKYEIPKTGIE